MDKILFVYCGTQPVAKFPFGKARVVRENTKGFTIVNTNHAGTWAQEYKKPQYTYKIK